MSICYGIDSSWITKNSNYKISYHALQHKSSFLLSRPYMYDTPTSYKNSLRSAPMRSGQDALKTPKSSRLIPLWVQFVFFLAVAAFLYIVFTNMESNEPFKGIN